MNKPKSRTQKAKLNMGFSLLQQGVAFVCGLIVPKYMLNAFGSEAYGATSSIATFLSYITLLEGGVGAVTRSALYKAFASGVDAKVSAVIYETKLFYKRIAIVFSLYVLVIALSFKHISHNSIFSYWYSFSLVIVIALSTFAEYFIGISYSLLLQADQLSYISVIFRIITTILNTVIIVVMTSLKCDLLTVKLLSSVVFVIKPILLSLYVKKRYRLTNEHNNEQLLVNKGSAVGQHLAWTIHNNTDISVLTILKDLTYVSVYSVYNMIVSQMQNILNAFSTGMEAVFGSMYANKEEHTLQKTFGYFETLISILSTILFSTAAVLIIPFIKLYTEGITDANYINPFFAFSLIIASYLFSLRSPYGHMIIAAGHFKETRMAAYGEAIINIVTSVTMVISFGLVGVAIGTVLATFFRFSYYAFYLSNHVLYRNIRLWIKRMVTNFALFMCIYLLGSHIVIYVNINSYSRWMLAGIVTTFLSGLLTILIYYIFYREDLISIISRGFGRLKIRK